MTLTTKELKSIQLIAEQLISYGLQRAAPIFTSTSKLKQLVPYYESGAIEISSMVSQQIILGEEVEIIVHHYKYEILITNATTYKLVPNEVISNYRVNDIGVDITVEEYNHTHLSLDSDMRYIEVNINRHRRISYDSLFSATMPNSYEALKQLSYLVHVDLYSTLNS